MQELEMITEKQMNFILKLDVTKTEKELQELSKKEASKLIGKLLKNQKENATPEATETKKENNNILYDFKNNFNEFKELFYKKEYSYFKENNYNTYFKYIVKLKGDLYYHIETPSIRTSFCYADDYDDYSDYNDPNNSWNKCEKARTDQEYFKRKNLEAINEKIQMIEEQYKIFTLIKHYNDNDNIVSLNQVRWAGIFDNPVILDYHSLKELEAGTDYIRVLTPEDKETILTAYKQVKKDFEKRIETYLKKYGLSKINVWTYWQNR